MAKSIPYSLPAILILGAWWTLAAPPASAQIYNWIDEKGNVNYGDKPPRNQSVRELDASTITLSVYEAPKFRQPDVAAGSDAASLGRKIDGLQRQLDRERLARQESAETEARYDPCQSAPGAGCAYNGYAPWPIVVRPTRGLRQAPNFRKGAKIFPVGKV